MVSDRKKRAYAKTWSSRSTLNGVSPSETLVPHFDCLLDRGAIASAIVLNLNQPISRLIGGDGSVRWLLEYPEKSAIALKHGDCSVVSKLERNIH
ncbi:MAG TPA: hypothetical protein V6C85_36995 [Allocoleopsis sp.]